MKRRRKEIDCGRKKELNKIIFSLEEKIKKYKKEVDYIVDETGNFYTILSERLKKEIWPDDYLFYDDSVVVIDREGKISSWRIAADNPHDPFGKLTMNDVKEIFFFDKKELAIRNEKWRVETVNKIENKDREEYQNLNTNKNVISWVIIVFFAVVITFSFCLKKD